MIGKIIAAVAGNQLAKTTSGIGGPAGAAIGVATVAVARRLSIPALLAVGAGGFLVKKYMDGQKEMPATKPVETNIIADAPQAGAPTL